MNLIDRTFHVNDSRQLLTLFGFQLTVLIHAAIMATTILAGLTFKPVQTPDKGGAEAGQEKQMLQQSSGWFWFPNLRQIFIWKVLRNPLFIVLTVSVIMGRFTVNIPDISSIYFGV